MCEMVASSKGPQTHRWHGECYLAFEALFPDGSRTFTPHENPRPQQEVEPAANAVVRRSTHSAFTRKAEHAPPAPSIQDHTFTKLPGSQVCAACGCGPSHVSHGAAGNPPITHAIVVEPVPDEKDDLESFDTQDWE